MAKRYNMALENYKRIYFIGIGGIGMSALARYFHAKGYAVAGYDKTPSPLTDELIREGMAIHFSDLGTEVPEAFRQTEETLVVYTPAIPKTMGELLYFQQNHEILKRSEVLGLITQSGKGLGVAGTHGKTTTSTMLAHVLSQSHVKCSAFLGGISTNFDSNVVIDTNSEYSVIEADEFDRSFLRLTPFASIITAMDPDHLDIYGTAEEFTAGFQAYADKHVAPGGFLVRRWGMPLIVRSVKEITYGIDTPQADYYGTNLRAEDGNFYFTLVSGKRRWEDIELGLPGIHNCENAVAVCAMCFELGLTQEEIFDGLCSFMGVRRRFEYHLRSGQLVYIDDYAHHPTEIDALISSVRLLYPGKHVTGIFQPHLFSRTRDFMYGFAAELSRLDKLILLPIYPAREEPIPGITSETLLELVTTDKEIMTAGQVVEWSKSRKNGVVLTIGAGDIDRIVSEIAVELSTWLL
jgi:UDP-N-acetylmuramate--alanine ligase